VTSGVRIGTPVVRMRGFAEQECELLAGWMCDVLDAMETGGVALMAVRDRVLGQVVDLYKRHPGYR